MHACRGAQASPQRPCGRAAQPTLTPRPCPLPADLHWLPPAACSRWVQDQQNSPVTALPLVLPAAAACRRRLLEPQSPQRPAPSPLQHDCCYDQRCAAPLPRARARRVPAAPWPAPRSKPAAARSAARLQRHLPPCQPASQRASRAAAAGAAGCVLANAGLPVQPAGVGRCVRCGCAGGTAGGIAGGTAGCAAPGDAVGAGGGPRL